MPEDGGKDPYIFSETKPLPPLSYLDPILFSKIKGLEGDAPSPTYMKYSSLVPSPDEVLQEKIFYGYELLDNGALKCVNQRILDKSKGVVSHVIKQAASKIFSGQDVIGVSLPVRIFEARSLIERIGDWHSFAPLYLKQAGKLDDHLERFKLCIAFAISGIYCSI